MQDDGCRFIANLTSISKLGAGRVGSVRLMALPDGTSAALSATQALLTRRQHHGADPVALHGADPIEFLWATSATDEDRCVAHCFAAFAGRCKVGRTVNFTKYVERMPARWRAKDARAHGRA